ncbi:MAG: hypothetical protein ACR2HM_06020 [Acidimicrobiales bacterium]
MNDGCGAAADGTNEEHRITTRIDGEEVRLLVHIEPIAGAEPCQHAGQEPRPDPPPIDE